MKGGMKLQQLSLFFVNVIDSRACAGAWSPCKVLEFELSF